MNAPKLNNPLLRNVKSFLKLVLHFQLMLLFSQDLH